MCICEVMDMYIHCKWYYYCCQFLHLVNGPNNTMPYHASLNDTYNIQCHANLHNFCFFILTSKKTLTFNKKTLVMSEMASVTWVTYLEIVIWVSNHNLILYQGYAMMSMDFFVYNVEIM